MAETMRAVVQRSVGEPEIMRVRGLSGSAETTERSSPHSGKGWGRMFS